MKQPNGPPSSEAQISFEWMAADPFALENAARVFLDTVCVHDAPSSHFIISCGKHKQTQAAAAGELYISPRFRLSAQLPMRLMKSFSVLSAKHGVLSPATLIEPYDVTLASMTRADRRAWADGVVAQLVRCHPEVRRYILLTDDDYRVHVAPLLQQRGFEVIEPLLGLDRSSRMSFLRSCHRLLDRRSAAQVIYDLFGGLEARTGLPTLREALNRTLPTQGVYFFFDPREPTRFSRRLPRLVRIGTHRVSRGSKATLRDRLRAHFGTSDGTGNHRSSVFRLHVGEALIRKNDTRDLFPHWGKGQAADKSISDSEKELERDVSAYISALHVLCIEVADRATKSSARSKIERLAIALFTERQVALEPPSKEWLGLFSAHRVIAQTGLWNVKDTGAKADLQIIDLISERIRQSSGLR